MSEDIKEIKVRTIEQQAIDNLKAIINSKDKIIEIEPPLEDTAQILLDCITNLQEENDILKRDIEAMKHNYNLLVRCIENGESMTQKFENGLTYQDYKSRNEKTTNKIELLLKDLKDMQKLEKETGKEHFTSELFAIRIKEIYKLLQGSDKE